MDPALAARLAAVPAGTEVPVLVTMRRQVDPSAFAGRPAALVRALRRTAQATQGGVRSDISGGERSFWLVNAVAATATAAEVAEVAGDPGVAGVALDPQVHTQAADALPAIAPEPEPPQGSWGITAIGAPAVWRSYGITGAGVTVGSIDTGVDPASPGIAGKIVGWRDFVGGREAPYDDNGHGTHTIGTAVGGDAGDGTPIGVAPGATVLVAKAMDAAGGARGSDLLAAGEWMAAPGGDPSRRPAVVVSSWEAPDANDPWFRDMVRTWLALGIVPVFAAGNTGPGPSTVQSPGGYPESIAVGAVDPSGAPADFSARGPVTWEDRDGTGPAAGTVLTKPDLAAPGVEVLSALGAGLATYSGTSMAAPHVAGVVALMRQANPAVGPGAIGDSLRLTARDLGPAGPDQDTGAGLVDALAAVRAAGALPAVQEAAPVPEAAPEVSLPRVAPRRVRVTRLRVTRRRGTARWSVRVRGALTGPARVRVRAVPVGVLRAHATPRETVTGRASGFAVTVRNLVPGRYRITVSVVADATTTPSVPSARVVSLGH